MDGQCHLTRYSSFSWHGRTSRSRFFHQDWLGSTRYLSDGSGNSQFGARYDAYGNRSATAGADGDHPTDYLFAGRWGYETEYADGQEPGLGLQYLHHRYYDPAVGRFLTPDPIGLAGGLNLYNYAGNNPVGFVDPDGRIPIAVGVLALPAVTAKTGAGAGAAVGVLALPAATAKVGAGAGAVAGVKATNATGIVAAGVLASLLRRVGRRTEPIPPDDDWLILYHYTSAPPSLFGLGGIWENTHLTDVPNFSAEEAHVRLGLPHSSLPEWMYRIRVRRHEVIGPEPVPDPRTGEPTGERQWRTNRPLPQDRIWGPARRLHPGRTID